MPSERVVLDSNYLLESILPTKEAWRAQALDLIERIESDDLEAVVPWLFHAEVASVCARRVRGGQLDGDLATDFLEQVDALPLQLDLCLDKAAGLYVAAMKGGCGTYDAIYLVAAKTKGLPLATRDRGLIAAAQREGVPVFT